MKFKIIYKIFALAFLAFIFQSHSAGPGTVLGAQVAGAPGSVGNMGTCANAGCHANNAFAASASIELLDGTDLVDQYEPGKSYTLRVTGVAGSGAPAGYGFQAVSLDGSDSQAGSWGDVGSEAQTVDLSGRSYAEHNSISATNTFDLEWIAPDANTGEVTFYSAVALVNGNGNSSGDGVGVTTLTIGEKEPNNTSSAIRELANLSVYPNPVQNELNIEITSQNTGVFQLRFVDISGKVIRIEQIEVNSGTNRKAFDVSDVNKGFYLIQLFGDDYVASTEMLKM
ncbi:MAG: T9SS type A sorting domain-containing protein [Saprospiraceae bacterium]|jgi:hypothetical protein|nr:T9SS type A sorting domain-containing protein [Saprospiraceae bacterium]